MTTAYDMDGVGAFNNAADQISGLSGIAQSNNAYSADQARLQREWTEKQNAKAMEYNSNEAAKNRDWQQMMSNTAHQREVADLKAAGLNPVLSAMNGNGASVGSGSSAAATSNGSGSKADTDTATSGAVANLLGSILAAQTSIEASNINARTQEAVADKYNAMSEIVANINANAALGSANIHAGATKYAADSSRAASNYSTLASTLNTQQTTSASRYSADKSAESSKYAADTNWYAKKTYGNGNFSSIVGQLSESLMNLFGKSYNKNLK